jgi:hypothetical protein
MKIIADTHIFYYLGDGSIPIEAYKTEPIAPTFINILELSKTYNLIKNPEYVRKAIRKIFDYQDNVIYEPPFLYLAGVYCNYPYDPIKEFGAFLEFTSAFASGVNIDENKTVEFIEWAEQIKSGVIEVTEFANNTLKEIKQKITNKKEHKEKNTLAINMSLINHFINANTNGTCDIIGIDLSQSELLIRVLDTFFKTLEVSDMKMHPNDWMDLTLLAYVHPDDKIWTREKRWINLIKQAGCEEYLFIEH